MTLFLAVDRSDIAQEGQAVTLIETIFSAVAVAGTNALIVHALARKMENNIAQRNRLTLAVVSRRLEAHQQALSLLCRLLRNPDISTGYAKKCDEWWVDNCLYLTEEASEAFRRACNRLPHDAAFDIRGNLLLPAATWALISKAIEEIRSCRFLDMEQPSK